MNNMDIHYDLTANELINEFTHGICGENENGPIEKVSSAQLKDAIAAALAAERAAGKVDGLEEAAGRLSQASEMYKIALETCNSRDRNHYESAHLVATELAKTILSLRTADKTGDGTK